MTDDCSIQCCWFDCWPKSRVTSKEKQGPIWLKEQAKETEEEEVITLLLGTYQAYHPDMKPNREGVSTQTD